MILNTVDNHSHNKIDSVLWKIFLTLMEHTPCKKRHGGEMDRRVIYVSQPFSDEFREKYEIEEIRKPKGRPKLI